MKIGRFTITTDKYNWILSEKYDGHDKDGNVKPQTRETYHGSLLQCCETILDRESRLATDLDELIHATKQASNVIAHACDGIKKDAIK